VSGGTRIYLRCLRWGLATGAVSGAAIGALLVLASAHRGTRWTPADVLLDGLTGGVVGAIVALIPTLIGAAFVTDLLTRRHPDRCSPADVRGDLTGVFRAVAAVLDVIVVVIVIASRAGLSGAAVAGGFIIAGNVCVALMLHRAGGSITRLWSAHFRAPEVSPARPAP
jgi:hypothetical protein